MVNKSFTFLLTLSLFLAVGCSNQPASREAEGSTTANNRSLYLDSGNSSGESYGLRTVDGLPVHVSSITPPYDFSSPDLVVEAKDHVLVGRVKKFVGTRHSDSQPAPQTDYDVAILEVIKGNLKVGQEIRITKDGGISEDESAMELFDEKGFMPVVGEVHIFLISVLPDSERTLSIVGSHSTVPLENTIVAELNRIERPLWPRSNRQELISNCLQKSEVYARYVAAAENKDAAAELPPEIRDRKRYKSIYEK